MEVFVVPTSPALWSWSFCAAATSSTRRLRLRTSLNMSCVSVNTSCQGLVGTSNKISGEIYQIFDITMGIIIIWNLIDA